MNLTTAVLSGYLLAAVSPWIVRAAGRSHGWVLALFPLSLSVYFGQLLARLPQPIADAGLRESHSWFPGLDIRLSFFADGLSLLFCLLISGVGTLVVIYAGTYLGGHRNRTRFYPALLTFMASMLGVVLADNILALFVFWELTSLSSYFLIGFEHERAEARAAALQALLVTGAGGLVLMAGLLLLGHAGGSYELTELMSRGDALAEHPLAAGCLLLILCGAFTKSAQFPFHFWLPNAMQAPTPVSAYLHSSTMVKAGVYLLARLSPVLQGVDGWFPIVTGVGAVTMVVGAWLAFRETYLKRILAYSTVSSLGILVMLLGVGTRVAISAAIVYLLAHALFKAALFLTAGAIDHSTGVRDAEKLGGLWRDMPLLGTASIVAALSMAGFPPLFGFMGKEQVLAALQEAPAWAMALTAAAALAAALTVAVAVLAAVQPFVGGRKETPVQPHEPPFSLWIGPALLAVAGVYCGLLPGFASGSILSPAVQAVWGPRGGELFVIDLHLWHGWNATVAISGAVLLVGAGCYRFRAPLGRLAAPVDAVARWGPALWYDWSLRGLIAGAAWQTKVLQNGSLPRYLLICIATAFGLAASSYALFGPEIVVPEQWWRDVKFYEAVIAGVTLAAAITAARSNSRFGAIAAMGVVGYGVALVYVLFGAPDLAMTQFVVETLTVILFVLAFYFLPPFTQISSRRVILRDAIVSLIAGAGMTALVLVAIQIQFHEAISAYFVEHSLPLAHGRNVVNVILVDFRGIDTLGEITVLGVAGVGVFALLKLRPSASNRESRP